MSYVTTKTFTGVDSDDMYFVQVDRNNVLFSDGRNGLWCYPGYGISTETAYQVKDLVPFLPDVNGSRTTSITVSSCPFAPSGRYLTYFRGRVFIVNPNSSTVYYSGTRTDYDRDDKDSFTPPHEVDTPIKSWELWNIRLDLSRANIGHGASMIIGKKTEAIRGIVDTEEGILVFKENQILLWTWPDSAAPHEVTQGADVQEIAANIGLVSYRTLVKDNGRIFFLGMVENGKYKIFTMNGGEINAVTNLVDTTMSRIVNYDTARGVMHGDYYILFADTGEGVKPFLSINVINGSIVEFAGADVNAVATFDAYGKILAGSGGNIIQFPGFSAVDADGTYYEIETQRIDSGKPFSDNKYRKFWSGIDTLVSENIVARDESLSVEFDFDDDTESYTETVSGRDTAIVNLNKRSNSMKVKLSGIATGKLRINNLGVAVRDRKSK